MLSFVYPSAPATTSKVQIDSSVVLKIVKIASDNSPSLVSGQLIGVDLSDTLNVTHAFPYPASANDNEGSGLKSKAVQKYQNDIISHLKMVNADTNAVGYFMSTDLGKYFSNNVIENLLHFQVANPNSILIVHDISQPLTSGLSLRALRLSEAFIAARKEGLFTIESLQKTNLSYQTIFTELPVTIKNSHLVTLFLQTLEKQNFEKKIPTSFTHSYNKFDISIDSYLEKNIEGIFDSVDSFHADQGNYNWYQRQLAREKLKVQQWQHKRKLENAALASAGKPTLSVDEWQTLFKLPAEPSRLESLLVSGQIDNYCTQIEEFGSNVSTKLFATQKSLDI